MMFKTIAASVALLALPTLASAHAGSAEDQMACTPDVYRLCSAYIPNETTIVACLQRNRASLSAPCRQVFSDPAPGQHKAAPKPANNNDDDDDQF